MENFKIIIYYLYGFSIWNLSSSLMTIFFLSEFYTCPFGDGVSFLGIHTYIIYFLYKLVKPVVYLFNFLMHEVIGN